MLPRFNHAFFLKKSLLSATNSLLSMKYCVLFGLLISILSSCAIYTKPPERKAKKDRKNITGTFQPEDEHDVQDGYTFGMITTPLLIAQQDFTSMRTSIPLGVQYMANDNRLGELTGNLFYMVEGFEYNEDAPSMFGSIHRRFKPRMMYAHKIWSTIETINDYAINLGRHDTLHYTAIIPVNVSIELSLRGGYDKQLIEFVSPSLNNYMKEQDPTSTVIYGDHSFQQMNGVVKFGLAFQRKMATSFDAPIKDVTLRGVDYNYQSLYADISFLVQPDNTTYYVSKDSDKVRSEEFLEDNLINSADYLMYNEVALQSDILQQHPFGFSIGYQRYNRPAKSMISTSFLIETGFFPGNYDRLFNGFYAKFGVGLGLGFGKHAKGKE